ncbi:hypothetical protein K435DRAFT_797320 [Dendrothele bispora CBS 962.96]|uniref:Uncharacterized protein n=1 Tax=Dendrothele bispora (strain CBS 962.96) TaxID=1314807 RepID=A0A4S8M2S8_DENBC|nr:hypothetical protein K435DRAFT_797320 [Dendrothele bispora CBS 962.96]
MCLTSVDDAEYFDSLPKQVCSPKLPPARARSTSPSPSSLYVPSPSPSRPISRSTSSSPTDSSAAGKQSPNSTELSNVDDSASYPTESSAAGKQSPNSTEHSNAEDSASSGPTNFSAAGKQSPNATEVNNFDDSEYLYPSSGPIRNPRSAPLSRVPYSRNPSPSTSVSTSSVSSFATSKQSSNTPVKSSMNTRSKTECSTTIARNPAGAIPTPEPAVAQNKRTGPIPRPAGENGRPGRGGYALKDILAWNHQEYKDTQKLARKLVETTLAGETHLPFTSQPSAKIDIIRNEMLKQFPNLTNYEENWVTDDFIRVALKYCQTRLKSRSRRR